MVTDQTSFPLVLTRLIKDRNNFLSAVCLSFMTPLHVAAERAHNDILEVLQKHGAKVCPVKLFVLHLFLQDDIRKQFIATVLNHPPTCSDPQINAVDTLGQTALHRAALSGHIQTCKLLLSYGADPSIVSLQGFTAAQMGNEAVQQILNGNHTHIVCFC